MTLKTRESINIVVFGNVTTFVDTENCHLMNFVHLTFDFFYTITSLLLVMFGLTLVTYE
jgi:hypothetical protein